MNWEDEQTNEEREAFYSCHCTPSTCRERCGHEIVDVLLHEQADKDPALIDALLDLKFALTHRTDALEILRIFCGLRRRLERRYYLAFYRLRRWLENQLEAHVSPGRGYAPRVFPVVLSARTSGGIRDSVREAARQSDPLFSATASLRVDFVFRTPSAASPGLLT